MAGQATQRPSQEPGPRLGPHALFQQPGCLVIRLSARSSVGAIKPGACLAAETLVYQGCCPHGNQCLAVSG